MFKRPLFAELVRRVEGPRLFIQVLSGPRQTGKTTLARQLMDAVKMPCHYATADEPAIKDTPWLEQQWEAARFRGQGTNNKRRKTLLVLDEVQKLLRWSETVKRLWDEDSAAGYPLQVVLLGSSPLLVQRGLSESLAGRFEMLRVTHWSFPEMRTAFDWSLNQYLYYGGYPGAAALIEEHERWKRYILDSLIETSVSRDVLLMTRVDKPALLRRLFELGCVYSGRILSYQKMQGQLQDAGNTTTLAHYLELLEGAGLILGLQKYAGHAVRRRASSPKLLALNTALMTVSSGMGFQQARQSPVFWGRLVETAVGAALANGLPGADSALFYWLSRNKEVDFVLQQAGRLIAIEVKSSRRRDNMPGLRAFSQEFDVSKTLLVGADGIPVDQFLSAPVERWLD